jgi:hypothetical protein
MGTGETLYANFLAFVVCRIWSERGHQVTVAAASPRASIGGDCALLHIDTSKIEPAWLPRFEPGMPVLNGRVLDISKRRISRNLVSPGDGYAGPVIVKTDANYYGIPRFPMTTQHAATIAARHQVTIDDWRSKRMLPLDTYPILASAGEVPDWVWPDPDLVVERFLPEREGELYVLRNWVFLGQRELGIKVYSRRPIVKAGNLERYEHIDGVPEELRAERRRLGFDFGKFDYVIHEGRAILLDANKTPTARASASPSSHMFALAEALSDMFPGRY